MQKLIKYSKRHPYKVAFLVGLIYYGLTISWMFGLRTSELAAGLSGQYVAFSAAILMTTSFAIAPVALVWGIRQLKLNLQSAWTILELTLLWIIIEYFRAILFSIVTFGPGARIGPYWVFGNLGLWLIHTPLVYASRIGGLYLLSGLFFSFILSIAWLKYKRDYWPIVIWAIVALVSAGSGWLIYHQPTGPMRQAVSLQYDSETELSEYAIHTRELLDKQSAHSTDLIVLPEYSRFWQYSAELDTKSAQRVLRVPDGLIIDSQQEKTNGLGHNLISYHDSSGQSLFQQAKWFIIPGGEFVPYVYQVILASAGRTDLLASYSLQKSLQPADKPEQPFEFESVKYGALACSGVISPDLYRDMARRGAEVLTSSASVDTLGVADLYHAEARDLAQFHAIANARPFIQSARGGLSYIIDSNGDIIGQTSAKGYGIVSGQIQANNQQTFYTKLGDWIVLLSFLFIGFRILNLVRPKLNRQLKKLRTKSKKQTK